MYTYEWVRLYIFFNIACGFGYVCIWCVCVRDFSMDVSWCVLCLWMYALFCMERSIWRAYTHKHTQAHTNKLSLYISTTHTHTLTHTHTFQGPVCIRWPSYCLNDDSTCVCLWNCLHDCVRVYFLRVNKMAILYRCVRVYYLHMCACVLSSCRHCYMQTVHTHTNAHAHAHTRELSLCLSSLTHRHTHAHIHTHTSFRGSSEWDGAYGLSTHAHAHARTLSLSLSLSLSHTHTHTHTCTLTHSPTHSLSHTQTCFRGSSEGDGEIWGE